MPSQYFTEQADSLQQARDKILLKYGSNAKILQHRNIKVGGIFGFFQKEIVEISGYISNEIIKENENINLKPKNQVYEEEKRKILNQLTKKDDNLNHKILNEIKELKEELIKEKNYTNIKKEENKNISKLENILIENDFSSKIIKNIISDLKQELSFNEIEDFNKINDWILKWLIKHVDTYDIKDKELKPYVVVLVGPTGVGKTTTIAKLAAMHGLDNNRNEIRIITIDNYRIGAKQQIETYGDIMDIPVICIENTTELKNKLDLFNDVDYIFIDTIGKGPYDFSKIGEMREILKACNKNSHFYLVLSATTKMKDIEFIMQQYESFSWESIIFTKTDETSTIGNILSVVIEKKKRISYITNGQRVPQDISKIDVFSLLKHLIGFNLNKDIFKEE